MITQFTMKTNKATIKGVKSIKVEFNDHICNDNVLSTLGIKCAIPPFVRWFFLSEEPFHSTHLDDDQCQERAIIRRVNQTEKTKKKEYKM